MSFIKKWEDIQLYVAIVLFLFFNNTKLALDWVARQNIKLAVKVEAQKKNNHIHAALQYITMLMHSETQIKLFLSRALASSAVAKRLVNVAHKEL